MSKRLTPAVFALLLPTTALAQIRLGAEFKVNSHTTGPQIYPSIASDADGNFVVAWASYAQPGVPDKVFARRYDASGAALEATEFQVADATTAGYDGYPFVTSDPVGRLVVVWRKDTGSSSLDVFARQYDPSGTPGGQFRVNTHTSNAQAPSGVASDAIGNFVVAWNSFPQDGSYGAVFARRYDALGAPRSGEFQVNTYTSWYQDFPRVASDAYGNFVVVWRSGYQDGSGYGIFGQRHDASGALQGAEFRVNSYTTADQFKPAVASDPNGNFLVVWTSSGQDGSGRGVFGQRYHLSGATQGSEFRVNSFTTADQFDPAVSADANGFVVAWTSFGEDGSSYAVMARRYDRGGVPQGGAFLVNTYSLNRQRRPSVASAGNGTFVVAWESLNQDGSGYGVFAQRFATDLIFRDGFDE